MRARTSGGHEPLRNALVIELGDLLPEDKPSSKVGPRAPLLREFWLSEIGAP